MSGPIDPVDDVGMETTTTPNSIHTPAWVAQVWISFGVSIMGLLGGIFHLDVNAWARAFLAAAALLCMNSTFALAKTIRDVHEEQQLVKRVDNARVAKLITENDPLSAF